MPTLAAKSTHTHSLVEECSLELFTSLAVTLTPPPSNPMAGAVSHLTV